MHSLLNVRKGSTLYGQIIDQAHTIIGTLDLRRPPTMFVSGIGGHVYR